MKRLLLLALLLLVPSIGWAQNTNTMPPMCTAASLLTTCVPQVKGTIARISDGNSDTVCVNSGAGTTTTVCQFNGTAWGAMAIIDSTGAVWRGTNLETMDNGTDGEFTFTRNTAGGVTIAAEDDAGNANLTIKTAGTGILTIGSTIGGTVALTSNGGINIGNSVANSIAVETDAGQMTLDGDLTVSAAESAVFGAPDLLFTTGPSVLNQYVGIPKLNVTHLGATLATGDTLAEGINPLAATCKPITAGTEAQGTLRITGAKSYQYTGAATAADNDGFDCDVTGPTVGDGTDSIGFWFRSDTALTAATLDVTLDDGTNPEANANMPAITVVDEWQWIEIDFATDCDADCTGIDGFFIQVTTAGAATDEMDGTVIHIDSGAIWLDTAEEAIGNVRVGGVISVTVAAHAAGSANTTSELVEYTDYIVNYQSSADALVMLTDQSAVYGWTLEALE
jgi:hypothetical protein